MSVADMLGGFTQQNLSDPIQQGASVSEIDDDLECIADMCKPDHVTDGRARNGKRGRWAASVRARLAYRRRTCVVTLPKINTRKATAE